ncbi:hypothetical protein GQ55_8G118500 [Panicum hallii var. hallii]|uniref:Uncharacterized protein n=1 Tax=Panicum hallii var. hallii TaxID=1504633 RepID=A0A2T7CMP6_9POAL|nr:hypothetical protein GQ55_8G118500 [Panicum hallii var. hallii]
MARGGARQAAERVPAEQRKMGPREALAGVPAGCPAAAPAVARREVRRAQ